MTEYFHNLLLAIIGRKPDQKELEEARKRQQGDARIISDYQKLVENLRTRLQDAEADHRQEMADLHACYKKQVEILQEKIGKAGNTETLPQPSR